MKCNGFERLGKVVFSLGLLFSVILGCYVLSSAGRVAYAAADSCVTDQCHSRMGKDKFVHGPVAVGDCSSCHKSQAKHKFAPIKAASDVCYKCHDKNRY